MAKRTSKASNRAPRAGGVAAVERALAIVQALESKARPMSLAELARDTQMYKSTLLRLLASLERGNLAVRQPDSKYALGQFAYRLGRAFEATYKLQQAVMPTMEWLIEQGTDSPSFHVLHDANLRLCMFRIDSLRSTLDRVRAGDLLPLHRGAPGKVLRAFRDGAPANRGTTLMYTSFGERDPACAGMSAPVFSAGGRLAGALSLSGPRERFLPDAIKRMTKPLLIAAERATRALGGDWPA